MSLLSELEELQRCLEDTTDSESETVLQHKAANDLDTLLHSEYMSLAGISEETHADSEKENEKVVTQDNGAINVSSNSKQDETRSQPTDAKKSGSAVDSKSIEVIEPLDSTLNPNSAEKITQSNSSAVNPKSTEITAVSDFVLNPKSIEDAVESTENIQSTSSLTSAAESIFPTLDMRSTASSCSIGNTESAASGSSDVKSGECPIESEVEEDAVKQEPVGGEMSKVSDCFVKIEHVFSMIDVNVGKRKLESESPSPKPSSVKKRKLYTEPPFESDLVEVPKGGTSPEALLKLQNSNQLLKIRKPRSSPVRKRIQSEGVDSVPGAKKKKMSNGNIGNTLPVEVVVSPLGVKEPLLEQVAERLGKELLEARVVLKRLNIPIPEHLVGTGITPAKLQNTLEEISKDIQNTLSDPLSEKKSRGKPKLLQAGPRKIKQTKPLQKKPPRRPKRSDVLAKASITARIGPKRKRIFTKKILASKIQSPRPVKNITLKKANTVTFKKEKPILKSKNVKKNSAPTNEIKSKKVSKTQNAEKVIPTVRINISPQRKLIPIKNNSVSLGKKTVVKKVTSDSVSKKPLVGKGTNIRKTVVKKVASDPVSKKALVGKGTNIRKGVVRDTGGKKSAVERNAAVSAGRKKPAKKPELNIVQFSPLVRPRRNIAEPHERIVQSRAKDEDNAGEDEWLVEYLIDEDVDFSTMKDKVSSSDDRRPISRETVPECDSSTDKKVRNCRRPASGLSKMDITAEWKMAEMKKAIGDLERIADRSMLRLKAEERQVIYLSNKLRYYESDKHFKMLRRILKDAAPGPKQNADAVFIVDLLLSYCPDDDSEDCNNSVTQASAR